MRSFIASALVAIFALACQSAKAQIPSARQVIHDYRQPVQYSPDDPWVRSAIFRQQVGYYGRFFNCDDEELKRYSPYIHWRCQDNRQCQRGPVQTARDDWNKVLQRIAWGSCDPCAPR